MSKTWKDIVKGNKGLYGNNTREIKNESVAEMVEKIIDNPKKFKSLLSYTQKSKIGKALADLFNRNKEDKVIKRAYSEFLNADKENKNQDYIEAKSRKTNKGDVKSSYEQTNEFRKLQETSRMLSSREVRAYNSGSKVFNEGLRKYLTDVFRRQIKRSSSGNAHSTRTLNFQNKVVANYEMVEEVNGELYHDIFEIAQKYLKFGDAVTVHKASYYNETLLYTVYNNYTLEDDDENEWNFTGLLKENNEYFHIKGTKEFNTNKNEYEIECNINKNNKRYSVSREIEKDESSYEFTEHDLSTNLQYSYEINFDLEENTTTVTIDYKKEYEFLVTKISNSKYHLSIGKFIIELTYVNNEVNYIDISQ